MKYAISTKIGNFFILLFLFISSSAICQISQQKGQAIFIYNFAKNIKWPNNPPSYNIGVMGSKDFYNELSTLLKDKQIDGKEIRIKLINSVAEMKSCQIVYLPFAKSNELALALESIGNKEILLITESDLSQQGAGISFLMVNDRLRFKVNKDAINKNGLQVASTLLSLAVK